MTDSIADMLTRIRNALIAHHNSVNIPTSRIKTDILRVLKEEGYINDYDVAGDEAKKITKVELKYTPEGEPVINKIERVSKPGSRIYVKKDEIPRVRGGLGISVLSTSRGVMSSTQARRLGVGGELICTVW
jgi:small subunit ribosomal protein S8